MINLLKRNKSKKDLLQKSTKNSILVRNDTPHHPSDIQRDREAEGTGLGVHPAGLLPRDIQRGDPGPVGH